MSATRFRISHNSSLVPVSISIRPSAISTTPVLMPPKSRSPACRSFVDRKGSRHLQRCLGFGAKESRQPVQNEAFGVGHDAIDQLFNRRNVLDQSDYHPAAPGAGIHLAVDHDLGIDAGDFGMDILNLEALALLSLDVDQTVHAGDRKSTRLNSSHDQISYA